MSKKNNFFSFIFMYVCAYVKCVSYECGAKRRNKSTLDPLGLELSVDAGDQTASLLI